jgi:predicted amidophosphoribosyltransferase
MAEADRMLCKKCIAISYVNAEFCKLCGEPLQQSAPILAYQQIETGLMAKSEFYKENTV